MANVQCAKFELIRQDRRTGKLTFRAKLTPAPNAQWVAVFHEQQVSERALGNPAVASINEDVIEFEVPDALSSAAADVIRRCIEGTNAEATKRQAAQQKQREAQQTQADDEWRRVQDKYRDGL